MEKVAYFDTHWGEGWPNAEFIRPYFLPESGPPWRFKLRTADGMLIAEGVDGTDRLPEGKGRVDATLRMMGIREIGCALMWTKWGAGNRLTYYSRGDVGRLLESVPTFSGTRLPVGIFIPFEAAWPAVQEFMETDGKLPRAIEWIASEEIPPEAFPAP